MRPSPPLPPPTLARWSWRALALLLPLGGLALAWAAGLPQALSWETLAAHRTELAEAVQEAPLRVGLAYALLYVAVVALSLPGAVFLTLAGGLLFGPWLGGGLAVISATLGACLVFLLVRTAAAPGLARRGGPRLAALQAAIEQDGFLLLLTLRLLPLLPFWLVNPAPALAGMRLGPYAAATMLGIIPGTLAFAAAGGGLDSVLAQGERPGLAAWTSMRLLLPLGGLALLSLAATLWRRHVRALQAEPSARR